ncbi:MAG: endonuclease/exonuclease/phosphatase family protein [Myxococcales bacterium FL481]|nr:MAG: endonuclease/exonuclease/phosphatase family protein [Myxococcales bacterium FL481]
MTRFVLPFVLVLASGVGAHAAPAHAHARSCKPKPRQVRFATFNVSLNRFNAGDLVAELSSPDSAQAQTIAEIIQRVDADVILLNEFDFDDQQEAIDAFRHHYLEVSQNGQDPVDYPYVFVAPSNTGVPSGFDLDNDGATDGPGDAFGFGFFPGQYGMVVLSKHRILHRHVRTFQNFRWQDMPGALLPDDPSTPEPHDWYSPEELDVVRLSSKSHWDVPVRTPRGVVHVLASHPTPPVFDGPEDRNGTRNHDEIRFWADYVDFYNSRYIYDDCGRRGGLRPGARFVIMGDLNADPNDGDSTGNPASLLLDNPYVNVELTPTALGGVDATDRQGGANLDHLGDPAEDTADFADGAPGNLRVDYVLPSWNLPIVDAAVFWPTSDDPQFPLVGDFPFPSSDHRAVYVDVELRRRR